MFRLGAAVVEEDRAQDLTVRAGAGLVLRPGDAAQQRTLKGSRLAMPVAPGGRRAIGGNRE